MRFIYSTYLVFFLWILPALVCRAQVEAHRDSSRIVVDTTLQRVPLRDTLSVGDTLSAPDSTRELFKVLRWKYHSGLESETMASDSTLRWQIWPNWTYKKNRDPGVISYRLGTTQRSSGLLVDAHEPRYQQLLWEDVSMNDPVSGTLNWGLIPQNKLEKFYAEDNGLYYRENYFLKQYYLNKPLSKLSYDESKYDMRSLEFLVSQNFTRKTNAEISYWDRRDGGEYANSGVKGRQIFARVFHQLDHHQAVKFHFLNTKYTIGEPFGYVIPDLRFFAFDGYTATPIQPSGESGLSASSLSMNYYRRDGDTTRTIDNLHAGLFFNSRKRTLHYSTDSTYYKVQSIGANIHKWFNLNPLQLEGSFSDEWFFNKDRGLSNVISNNWNLVKGETKGVFKPFGLIELHGAASFRNRSDGYNDYRLNAGTDLRLGSRLKLSANIAKGTIMPTPQQLYWESEEYHGNVELRSERVNELHANLLFNFTDKLSLGMRSQLKDIKNGIMVGGDSTFANMTPYNSASASAYFDYNGKLLELNGSATYQQYGEFTETPGTLLPMDGHKRVWLKGGAYIKGYLFHRATYIKMGLSGMMAPFRYQAGHYNSVLDFWQPVSDDQYLPVFNRLDVDVSARIRTIMIVLRWENVLDDVNQLGYFEAAGYPMPGRRFIFGIRALFRN